MAETINLNSIKTGSCGCNKPHPVLPPHQPPCGCISSHHKKDEYFKVANLFNELDTDWQRAEARSNLGITEIIDLELIKFGEGSGDSNIWKLDMRKGCETFSRYLVVKNGGPGEDGKDGKDGADGITPTISIGTVTLLNPGSNPTVENVGTGSNVVLNFGIPKGDQGKQGDPGNDGEDGEDGNSIVSVELRDYGVHTRTALDQSITSKMFIWKIKLKNNQEYEIWVPEGLGGGGTSNSLSSPKFLYKLLRFDKEPTELELINKVSEFSDAANISSTQGRSLKYMTETLGWNLVPPLFTDRTRQAMYMASAVVTVDENNLETTGPWAIVLISGMRGAKGKDGDDGGGSDGEQGPVGPVIRFRGLYDENECYVNESYTYDDGSVVHFIDIVEDEDGHLYKVREGVEGCACNLTQSNCNDWVQAVGMNFAYIKTLITLELRSFTIDVNEIRIHDTGNNNGVLYDKIVAGMTGGKAYKYPDRENVQEENDAGDIRIWAGTDLDILSLPNSNGKYRLNIQDAPFRVTNKGKVFASDVDVEGVILANTLRLGELNPQTTQGTFKAPKTNAAITLPKLKNNKILVFYLLTNLIDPKQTIRVNASLGDYIKESNTSQLSSFFNAKAEKLYSLYGMDIGEDNQHLLVWHVIEQDMAAATSIVPGTNNFALYGIDYTGSLEVTISPSCVVNHKVYFNVSLTLRIINTSDYKLSVLVPFMSFPRNLVIKDNSNNTLAEGIVTVQFTPILIECPAHVTTSFRAEYENDGATPGMARGGDITTITTNINGFTTLYDGLTVLNATMEDQTPIDFSGFTANLYANGTVLYNMPGQIIARKNLSESTQSFNFSNNTSFFTALGITFTSNE